MSICVLSHIIIPHIRVQIDGYLFSAQSLVNKWPDRSAILKIHQGIEFEVGTSFVRIRVNNKRQHNFKYLMKAVENFTAH